MKPLLLLTLLVTSAAFAGEILGIPDGTYVGSGVLHSKSLAVPDLRVLSHRTLANGVVSVTSSASLHGKIIKTVVARLRFVPKGDKIHILNLDENNQKAGEATCDGRSCTFSATINKGGLFLTETWVRDGDGFLLKDGSQTVSALCHWINISHTYEVRFVPVHP